jgi:hypothetical protein
VAKTGTVLFCGEVHVKKGTQMYGIQLDKPIGKNNGVVDGKTYFGPVKDLHGLFVPMVKVSPAKRASWAFALFVVTDHAVPGLRPCPAPPLLIAALLT